METLAWCPVVQVAVVDGCPSSALWVRNGNSTKIQTGSARSLCAPGADPRCVKRATRMALRATWERAGALATGTNCSRREPASDDLPHTAAKTSALLHRPVDEPRRRPSVPLQYGGRPEARGSCRSAEPLASQGNSQNRLAAAGSATTSHGDPSYPAHSRTLLSAPREHGTLDVGAVAALTSGTNPAPSCSICADRQPRRPTHRASSRRATRRHHRQRRRVRAATWQEQRWPFDGTRCAGRAVDGRLAARGASCSGRGCGSAGSRPSPRSSSAVQERPSRPPRLRWSTRWWRRRWLTARSRRIAPRCARPGRADARRGDIRAARRRRRPADGGYFMWVKLPGGVEEALGPCAAARCARARAPGPGRLCACAAFLEEDDLKEAESRLTALAAAARGELPAERAPSQAVTD